MGPASLNSPVDEIPGLQVSHARGNLSGHIHKSSGANLLSVATSQVVQQVTMGHEFRHDVERWLTRTHSYSRHRYNNCVNIFYSIKWHQLESKEERRKGKGGRGG